MPDLTRHLSIAAPPALVFEFLTTSALWASWWGPGSTIDARPGGAVLIQYPNGVRVSGTVLELTPPHRIVFTYGYESGQPIPPGASTVTITLAPSPTGTALTLTHEFTEITPRDLHIPGWRYQLSVFANLIADRHYAAAPALIDAWFAAWALTDADERATLLATCTTPDITFHDRHASIVGRDELNAHITAAQRFMPGLTPTLTGEPRHCQGQILAAWTAGPYHGFNVFTLGPTPHIQSVTGFARP
jgi:uncharacterized protein YndB with AHSA1/START domain